MVTSPFYPVDVPSGVAIHQLLLAKLKEHGDKRAMVDGMSGQTLTFRQILDKTTRLASALYKLGLRKGDVVAVFSPNVIHYGVLLYAGLSVGAIMTTANPQYTKYELAYHMKDSTAKFIFTNQSRVDTVKQVKEEVSTLEGIICENGGPGTLSLSSLLADDGSAWPTVQKTPFQPADDVALLPYSSGTTGLPKGVMITHHNLIANLMQMSHPMMQAVDVDPDAPVVTMGLLPFYHVYGQVSFLVAAMARGATVVVMSKFQPRAFLNAIEKYKIGALSLVPALVLFLTNSDYIKDYDLSSVKFVGSGAAPLSVDAENAFKAKLPNIERMRQGYGMTETTLVALSPGAQKPTKPGSVGLVLPMTEAKIIDVESGRLCGPNERGELCLRGPQIMKGYWNKPEATSNTIDDFGFLHTGDIAYYDNDGYFFIVDRIKELIKCKGLQVAPAELEAVLLTHPLVADVGVTGIPHPTSGEVPRAYVVLKSGKSATADKLKAFLAEKVSDYKRLDGGVFFVEEIPRNPSGKILRRKLKEMTKSKL